MTGHLKAQNTRFSNYEREGRTVIVSLFISILNYSSKPIFFSNALYRGSERITSNSGETFTSLGASKVSV